MYDTTERYQRRAQACRVGLWGNHGYEATPGGARTDVDGEPLDRATHLHGHHASPPPVSAVWSITLHELPHFYPSRTTSTGTPSATAPTVSLVAAHDDDSWRLDVRDAKSGKPRLTGSVTSLGK